MDLIRFETLIDFSEESRVATPAESVFKALTGKDSLPRGKPREPGVRIRNEKERRAIVWHYDSCSILFEDMPDHNYCIDSTIKSLEKINVVAPLHRLKSRSLIIFWILPTPKYDFKSLEAKYRESFIKRSPIFDNCIDIDASVIIDMKYDNCILHHQSGAMDIAQLQREYRAFGTKEGCPKLFIFLETTIRNPEVVEYSRENMEEYLHRSFEKGKAHSIDFQKIMEGIL